MDDAWMPCLFSRLRMGSIWYDPRFVPVVAAGRERKDPWASLATSLKWGRCTPILGPGLVEPLFGHPRELAQRWAEKKTLPLAPLDRVDLPQVAEYLATLESSGDMRSEFLDLLEKEVRRRQPELTAGRIRALAR